MDAKPKRTYQKPTIERINLLGEETTQAACKQDTGGGKNAVAGTPCRTPSCKWSLGS